MARIQELALNRGNRGLLLRAVLAGLVAAALVFVALANSGGSDSKSTTAPALASKAVVAKQDIAAGTTINVEMVEVVDVPQNLLIPGAFADTNIVVGQAVRFPVQKGEQLSPAKVGVEPKVSGLSGVVPNSMRGVAVSVQQVTAVGGLILPGDRVDIVVTQKFKVSDTADLYRTSVLLQNVEVLSVAQEAQKPAPVAESQTDPKSAGASTLTSGQLPKDVKEQPEAGTITVALDPAQVLSLLSVQDCPCTVRSWGTLRNFGDASALETQPVEVVVAR